MQVVAFRSNLDVLKEKIPLIFIFTFFFLIDKGFLLALMMVLAKMQ